MNKIARLNLIKIHRMRTRITRLARSRALVNRILVNIFDFYLRNSKQACVIKPLSTIRICNPKLLEVLENSYSQNTSVATISALTFTNQILIQTLKFSAVNKCSYLHN